MTDKANNALLAKLGNQLHKNKLVKAGEIFLLFILTYTFITLIIPLTGDNPLLIQAVVWTANILMLIYVWIGLKLRGESWKDFGLVFGSISLRSAVKVTLLSLLVFALAVTGFLIGSIIMANITGIPEGANMSGYDYLKGNIWMLIITLAGVYIVSSFGEEVIYRGFLINRISQIGNDSKKATIIAVILSSVIFGLIHYAWGPMGIVQIGFMGLALGISYIKLKKRLWILILAHAYMDTILMAQLYIASS
ncbi:CPBP family intramembrane glutamic endopeptidase [Robiginitalea sp. IMCC43444]|uniref:CPBP family intramembrane glutamic endopeptidase n=1 Tax=Robiginitalea sp. IMCC43444 TaxID=3459121 RepID=UPI004042CFDE